MKALESKSIWYVQCLAFNIYMSLCLHFLEG